MYRMRNNEEYYDSASGVDSSDESNGSSLSGSERVPRTRNAEKEGEKSFEEEQSSENEQRSGEEQSDEEGQCETVDVPLNPMENDILRAALEGDSEIWLVRVPRHATLRNELLGSEITIQSEETRASISGRNAGYFKGSYAYRDHGPLAPTGPRPVFVTRDASGTPQMEIGKMKLFAGCLERRQSHIHVISDN